MVHRLFVGLHPDKPVRDLCTDFVNRNQQLPSFKWIPEEKWHLTVLFLGDVENDQVSELATSLKAALIEGKSFYLDFHRFQYGPSLKKARMVWAVFHQNAQVQALFENLKINLSPWIQKKSQSIQILPHITLARAPYPLQHPPELTSINSAIALKVESVYLLRSHLVPPPPRYTILHHCQLNH